MILHLLDIPPMAKVLEGVLMEINDCAFPLVKREFSFYDVRNPDSLLCVRNYECTIVLS